MQVLVNAFEPEKMLARVSSCQSRSALVSAVPPQRLTTRSPSTQTATAAPTSPCSRKLSLNARRTRSKRGSQAPLVEALRCALTSLLTATAVGGLGYRAYGR